MNKNTKKAILKRLERGEKVFTIGEKTYYVQPERRCIIYYLEHVGGPQIIYFDELEG